MKFIRTGDYTKKKKPPLQIQTALIQAKFPIQFNRLNHFGDHVDAPYGIVRYHLWPTQIQCPSSHRKSVQRACLWKLLTLLISMNVTLHLHALCNDQTKLSKYCSACAHEYVPLRQSQNESSMFNTTIVSFSMHTCLTKSR